MKILETRVLDQGLLGGQVEQRIRELGEGEEVPGEAVEIDDQNAMTSPWSAVPPSRTFFDPHSHAASLREAAAKK